MTTSLEVPPGKSIGPIQLGMRPAEVLAAFPEPQVYEDWMHGYLNDSLTFQGLRLHFTKFDEYSPSVDSTLFWVVVLQRPEAYLFGKQLTDWCKDDLVIE